MILNHEQLRHLGMGVSDPATPGCRICEWHDWARTGPEWARRLHATYTACACGRKFREAESYFVCACGERFPEQPTNDEHDWWECSRREARRVAGFGRWLFVLWDRKGGFGFNAHSSRDCCRLRLNLRWVAIQVNR